MRYIIITYIMWNIITFIIMGIDKHKAQKNKWRISESTLLITAFLMGGIGSFTGSQFFRHKTQKTKFRVLLPLAILFNLFFIYIIINKSVLNFILN